MSEYAGKRLVVFDVQDLVNLLTHYTDGAVPLDFEVKSVGFSKYFNRLIGIIGTSAQWDKDTQLVGDGNVAKPLQFRYEGKKTLTFHSKRGEAYNWVAGIEPPPRKREV